ncbi:tethering complex subunit PEP5 [Aspergillus thermomutatus]|uniref:RING-type domain-containing protein n=1 Tax=Aspergillus thermomutatus TaxID=41047 RepID=A0A397H584_ASPTH|nr:uncharacterized protein CDV56_107363 [Aspergillus thermomutatus]RHZ58245.1 hypothetical protein CDV56_107363 [Aspergillus thermomutatus]
MPPRPPASPLSLEICSPSASDMDIDGVLGSDEELDEADWTARRQRIERLAESYLNGTPLFILSASLRGPFDRDWVNPWKKSRRRASGIRHQDSGPTSDTAAAEEIVIQETNSRKRRRYHELQDIRGSNYHVGLSDFDVASSLHDEDLRTKSKSPLSSRPLREKRSGVSMASQPSPKRSIPWARLSSLQGQDQEPSPFVSNDASWLKKDRVWINSRNVDPPTSPTTTVSSRQSDMRARATATHSTKRQFPTNAIPSQRRSSMDSSNRAGSPVTMISRQGSIAGKGGSKENETIVSSSSQLPKFEYRRRKVRAASREEHTSFPMVLDKRKSPVVAEVMKVPDFKADRPPQAPAPRNVSFADAGDRCQSESSQASHTLTKSDATPASPPGMETARNPHAARSMQANTSEKLHSAQRVPGNSAMMDCATSLHTIAVSKEETEYDGDTIPDAQFSTQAAVLLAQRSFQNDLESPEPEELPSRPTGNPTQTPNPNASPPNEITPFYQLNTPGKAEITNKSSKPPATGLPVMSTQCIIDAVTPFTFSTEKKKSNYRVLSSAKSRSGGRKSQDVNLATRIAPSTHSSPSPSVRDYSELGNSDAERNLDDDSRPEISILRDFQPQSQNSVLPMTLTGTTPPTAQDGQGVIAGADSFSLSQAIADAGSWLQQSFEINRDLQQCNRWKAFNFFDVSSVKLPEECSSILKSDLTSLSAGSSNLFIGSTDGLVHIVSAGFKIVRSFKAADNGSITHIKRIEGTSLLITIAEDLPNEPVLKVWALDKPEKKTGAPRCLSTTSIQNARRPFPISAFAALEDLSQVAVGFGNGSVTIIRGDLIHDRGARQRIVFESEEPITGLEVQSGVLSTLFISTTSRILTLVISGRGQGQPARVLDDSGCGVGCMALDKDTGDIVVAREDAIYTYGPHGRGPSYAFDSPKNSINVFRDYVALVCPPRAALGNLRSQADEIFSTTTFTLLDTDLKFIAHSESLAASVRHIFIEWGDLFLLSTDGKVYRYREKSLQQKLEILYQRNLYILAINLAQKKGVDALQQNAIYRKYGDFLYQKGDYDTAMQQYLRAIDNTEPSQVIRKYLDTQRIHNLIEYLEELHDHDRATVDHTTLLLNCYAKLKDTDKLNSFIKAPGELKFDLETAIAMCRQGGYYEQAAYLATKYGENDMVIDILIEDSKKYAEAVEYIWRLEPDLAYHNLMKYARVLLANCPQETTELFMAYYKGQYRPRTEVEVPAAPQTQPTSTLQSLAGFLPLSLINAGSGAKAEKPKDILDEETKIAESTPSYEIPRPRTAFSAFVGRPQEFIAFLESLIDLEILKEDKVDIYTTLFEMYLDTANRKKDSAEKEEWENKAKTLIEGKDIPISTSNVLLLSDLSNFREGSTLVREQEGLRSDIFRSFTSAKDTRGAIRALRKYGPEEPRLYVDALTYFASSPAILEEAGDELDVVLKRIHDDGLMSPLQVIQALSNNSVVTMGRVKKYLSDNIERERKEISTNRRLISSYSSETEKKRQEIEQLGTKPVVFQARRCMACGGALDLPTVHFLCKHSFHQRCLNKVDEDAECPMCAQENSTIKAIRRRQVESADQHDLFKGELQRAKDRFGVISEFFGRGVMRPQSTMES